MIENKNSYFYLKLKIPEEYKNSSEFEKKINYAVDDILYSMNSPTNDPNNYKITSKEKDKKIHIFRTNNRKRNGQLDKFCKRFIKDSWNVEYESKGIRMDEIPNLINKAKRNEKFILEEEIIEDEQIYRGRDIKIFENKENWHRWQKEVFDMLFETKGKIKVPDDRKIISLIDFKGNSGKSSYWKYLYANNKKNIGRLTYGTTSQLKSSIVNMGKKKIYIIDLARTLGTNDTQKDLLAVIEDLKSGLILSPMYGMAKELMIEPPHIILSSNYLFDIESLSKDRWEIFEIKNNKLEKKNELIRKKIKEKNRKK